MLSDLGFVNRAIDKWPGTLTEPGQRKRSPFGAQWGSTTRLLRDEMRHLKAAHPMIVMQAVHEHELRADGTGLLKGVKLEHPGIVLAFGSRYGPLKYACDRFTDQQSNVRAIALGLEALRKVERYGISRRGEQYQGYRQLSGAVQEMTPEIAANVLEKWSKIPAASIASDPDLIEMAFKVAAKKTHPDAGGNDTDFKAVEEARRILAGSIE